MSNSAASSMIPLSNEGPEMKLLESITSHYVLMILGLLWIGGILYVEYLYYYTRRLRMLDPKIKEKMGPFTNEPEKWNKIVFYFCIH